MSYYDLNNWYCDRIDEGIRYDIGDKLGYLKATVEYALRNEELGESFKAYLKELDLK